MKKNVDLFTFSKIYNHLEDTISREIFQARFMYSISESEQYLGNLILNINGMSAIDKIKAVNKNEELILFGSGRIGKALLRRLTSYNWKCVIDNNPQEDEINGGLVISAEDFLQKYNGEYIVISSSLYHKSMREQLNRYSIPEDKIINFGEVASQLPNRQYFDLKFLNPSEKKEIFIDAGCYDGTSSKYFCEWCLDKANAKIYAFEADKDNVQKCGHVLEQLGIEYELIEKGLWSHNTTLCFKAEGTVGSRIDEVGEDRVEVVSLDKYLQDEIATFIKMDIEGAELEALKGAEQQIRKYKPKLAISIYHKPNDIWEIPKLILEYNPEYKLYLRHYTFSEGDTILYAI